MMRALLRSLRSAFKIRRRLAIANPALRQQLAVLKQSVKRLRFSQGDRWFWVLLGGSVLTGTRSLSS